MLCGVAGRGAFFWMARVIGGVFVRVGWVLAIRTFG